GNEYTEGHPAVKRDKEYWIAIRRKRQLHIQETGKIHRKAWAHFQCSTAGLPGKYVIHLKSLVGIREVVEDLTMEEWHHIPETDHIASADPIDMVISRTAAPNRR